MQSTIMTDAPRRVSLFAGLFGEQLAWISDKGTEVYLQPGQKIGIGQETTQRATRETREVSR